MLKQIIDWWRGYTAYDLANARLKAQHAKECGPLLGGVTYLTAAEFKAIRANGESHQDSRVTPLLSNS